MSATTPRKSAGPRNSLGRPWVEGEAWSCTRCGKRGPDRDDVAMPLCLPREGAAPSLAAPAEPSGPTEAPFPKGWPKR